MECIEKVIVNKLGTDNHSNFKLIYPIQAIERKLEDLRKTQADFEGFMNKVLGAFTISLKDSKAITL